MQAVPVQMYLVGFVVTVAAYAVYLYVKRPALFYKLLAYADSIPQLAALRDYAFKLAEDNRAASDIIAAIIMVAVVLAVLMLLPMILAPLQQQAQEQINALNNSQASSTFNNIVKTTWGSINLYAVVPYVMIFIVIIGLLLALVKIRAGAE